MLKRIFPYYHNIVYLGIYRINCFNICEYMQRSQSKKNVSPFRHKIQSNILKGNINVNRVLLGPRKLILKVPVKKGIRRFEFFWITHPRNILNMRFMIFNKNGHGRITIAQLQFVWHEQLSIFKQQSIVDKAIKKKGGGIRNFGKFIFNEIMYIMRLKIQMQLYKTLFIHCYHQH